MRIICFKQEDQSAQLAVLTDSAQIYLLQYKSFLELMKEAEIKNETCLSFVQQAIKDSLPIKAKLEDLTLTLPIQPDEVWASRIVAMSFCEPRS